MVARVAQDPETPGTVETGLRSLHSEVVVVDPLQQAGWDSLLARQAQASFFHGSAWARVLHGTYGHRPFYFSRIHNGRLEALLPVMEVASPFTGRRGVSLPFTDFSQPFDVNEEEAAKVTSPMEGRALARPGSSVLCQAALEQGRHRGWRYLECRGGSSWLEASPSMRFWGHVIDLLPGPEKIYKGFEGSTRRGIRKAEEAGVSVRFESDLEGIGTYYALHCKTRAKHGLPPQPFRFFENIARHVLASGFGFVAVARHEERPIAAAIYFHSGCQAIYKYGASDLAYQHLRPNNLVMWESIKRCAQAGFSKLHLGRTSIANEGLRRFKLGFGAKEERIDYFKYDFRKASFVTDQDRAETWVNNLFRLLPLPLLRLSGRLLYPHLS